MYTSLIITLSTHTKINIVQQNVHNYCDTKASWLTSDMNLILLLSDYVSDKIYFFFYNLIVIVAYTIWFVHKCNANMSHTTFNWICLLNCIVICYKRHDKSVVRMDGRQYPWTANFIYLTYLRAAIKARNPKSHLKGRP